jgi:pyruvate dehydrogenase E2 component (dihydrolipoamide acetyltransferase)
MAYELKLPDIGEGVAEGEIVRWLVKAGDAVKEDQPLVEVMTDKASVEIPSPRTGTIETLHAEEGEMVPVGTVIVTIATAASSSDTAPAATAHAAPASAANATSAPAAAAAPAAGARIEVTPAVRALAKELGVALESIKGTGPNGRITADDVKGAGASTGSSAAVAAPTPDASNSLSSDPDVTRVPLRGLRRKIADAMRRSLSTAAQFTFVAECDFTNLVAHRAKLKPQAEASGVKLTYLAYVFRALPAVLTRFPLLNSSLDDATQEVILKHKHHLGVATNTDDGLTVPILHDAGSLGLFAIAREIDRLATAAREHKLKLEELQGGTFSVTSTGTHGGLLATPILHHPQVAILGLHAITPKPAVVHGQIVARDMGNLSLSMDHRVVDGAVGADFLYALIESLQTPESWLNEGDLR